MPDLREPPPPGYLLNELGYIDETEAAVAIDVTPQTLTGYRKHGIGPQYTELARRILYSKDALAEWLRKGGTKQCECIAVLLCALTLMLSPALAQPSQITGPARVTDGNTVTVNGVTIRLKGVDTSELGTLPCEAARRAIVAIVTGPPTCQLTAEKTWKREVAVCFTADCTDINRAIIEQGAALSCPRYSSKYLAFETAEAVAAQPRAHCFVRGAR